MVTYQWSCPNYGCGVRGLQTNSNIVSRREEGNTIAIDVVNGTDSGDYTCNVSSSGRVLGSATYRIEQISGEYISVCAVYVCAWMYACVRVCMYMCVHPSLSVCVLVCVCDACVCMCGGGGE